MGIYLEMEKFNDYSILTNKVVWTKNQLAKPEEKDKANNLIKN